MAIDKSKKNMIIADDSGVTRSVLKEIFKTTFNIFEATNGHEVFDILDDNDGKIDIILLDLIMPKLSGIDFLRQKLLIPAYKSIPTIVITAISDTDMEIQALNNGAVDLITKPFVSKVVKQRVFNIVNKYIENQIHFENELHKNEIKNKEQLQIILDNMVGGVSLIYCDKKLTKTKNKFSFIPGFLSQGFNGFAGYTLEEHRAFKGYPPYLQDYNKKSIHENIVYILKGENRFEKEYLCRRKDGSPIWIKFSGRKILSVNTKLTTVLLVMVDITDEKNIEIDLIQRAELDPLTGMFNKQSFFDHTKKLLEENTETEFIMLRWNIEKFKITNDLFGKEVGDQLLINVAKRIKEKFANIGTCGRLESDHFVACIPKSAIPFIQFDEKNVLFFDGVMDQLTPVISVGIYDITDPNLPLDQMCDRTNLALQKVKGNYLKHYAIYDSTQRAYLLNEQEIYNDMERALKQKEFVFYLQPIINIKQKQITSAEALVRWQHPTKGLMSPSEFIPFFEKNGFIQKLDYHIWELVCKYLKFRENEGMRSIPISVNISRVNLQNPNLCQDIIKLANKYNLNPRLLKLEITESAYNDNPESLNAIIKELQAYGFAVHMDDFGSGYSSLNLLKDFTVDVLKIDLKFLDGNEVSNRAKNIISSVVQMAKKLNITTVAEGVETKAHVDFLVDIGCDNLQGYYFSKPLNLLDFQKIENNNIIIDESARRIIINKEQIRNNFYDTNINDTIINSLNHGVAGYYYNKNSFELIFHNKLYGEFFNIDYENERILHTNGLESLNKSDFVKIKEICDTLDSDNKSGHLKIDAFGKTILIFISLIQYDSKEKYIYITAQDRSDEEKYKKEIKNLKKSLDLSFDDFKSTLDEIPCGILELSTNPITLKKYNQAFLDICGVANKQEFDEVYENDFINCIYPDDRAYVSLVIEYYSQIEDDLDFKVRIINKSGNPVWVIGKANTKNFNNNKNTCLTLLNFDKKINELGLKSSITDDNIRLIAANLCIAFEHLEVPVIHHTSNDKHILLNINPAFDKEFDCRNIGQAINLSEVFTDETIENLSKPNKDYKDITLEFKNGKKADLKVNTTLVDYLNCGKIFQNIFKRK